MRFLRRLWRGVMGDDAYARYCDHLRRRHPEQVPMSRRQFYLATIETKYQRPSRCC